MKQILGVHLYRVRYFKLSSNTSSGKDIEFTNTSYARSRCKEFCYARTQMSTGHIQRKSFKEVRSCFKRKDRALSYLKSTEREVYPL